MLMPKSNTARMAAAALPDQPAAMSAQHGRAPIQGFFASTASGQVETGRAPAQRPPGAGSARAALSRRQTPRPVVSNAR